MPDKHSPDEVAKKANAAGSVDNENHASNEIHDSKAEPKKEPPKPKTTLESVVNETSHLFWNTIKLGLAGALPYTQAAMVPQFGRDTGILAGAQIASDYTTSLQRGKKYTAGNLLESSAIGTAITVPLETMFRTVNRIPLNNPIDYLAKAGAWSLIAYPAFNGLYLPLAYLIRKRTFSGMGKYVKENYWPILKKSWKYILPFSLLNVFLAPAALQIPIAAALSFVYDRFTADKSKFPEDQKRDKTPYLVAAPSAAYKLVRNSVKGLYDVGNAVVNSVSDLYKNTPKAATPATAGAHP